MQLRRFGLELGETTDRGTIEEGRYITGEVAGMVVEPGADPFVVNGRSRHNEVLRRQQATRKAEVAAIVRI